MVANSSALSDNVQEGVQVVSGRSNSGSFNMYGGTITGNSGGVTVGKGSTVMVSGGAKITGNTRNGSVCNVSLPNGKTITVGGKLTGGAGSIGVTTVAVPTAHTPVTIAAGTDGYALTDDDKNAFTLDSTSGGYTIAQDGNRIILSASHTHSWTYVLATTNTEHDTITAICKGVQEDDSDDFDGGSMTISAPTDRIYDGAAKEAVLKNGISDLADPVITYQVQKNESWVNLTSETKPTDAGTYKASITVDNVTASVEYTIERHDHCICGKDDSVPVAGHTHMSAPAWRSWDGDSELPTQTGYYYLTKDVTLTKTWTPPKETVLCLNGKPSRQTLTVRPSLCRPPPTLR
jgi:hypothetical protein